MRRAVALASLALALAAAPSFAEETRVSVHVLSRDAKLIGSSMGGARVTIRVADTGELLAEGVTRGSTGDTQKLVVEPVRRGVPVSTPDAGRFDAVLDLDVPTLVEVRAHGPLAQLQSAVSATKTLWLLPGKHMDVGDGVLLELSGFAVDVLAPPVHARLPREEVEVRANLVML
jgi:hypothetical protein